ncbi:MAG: biotin-dependent carboxyltransferase family protein [Syntrophales bacterium]|nr:biotin-dependent carboxyltransferase family protein [Syntrophales bacterium]
MIEILNPGFMSLIVDRGRYGFASIGVPPSSVLDDYAYDTLCTLLGREHIPVIEVIGSNFGMRFGMDMTVAVTGARLNLTLDGSPVKDWSSFHVPAGSEVRVRAVKEGFRYYIGFSGSMVIDKVIGSYSTYLECQFGGLNGRSLKRGDVIQVVDVQATPPREVPEEVIPSISSFHEIRIIPNLESQLFEDEDLRKLLSGKREFAYTVSVMSNRTGIRLEGMNLRFKQNVQKSIVSEGVIPGTIQVPGDGFPIIVLYERTIGGYARIGVVCKADRWRLAHLKPMDQVVFKSIDIGEALVLYQTTRMELIKWKKSLK